MIIRSALKCETCGKLHVVRIGMGREEKQTHRFSCRGCKEEIGVSLLVDYQKFETEVIPEDNAVLAIEEPGAAIVNLDANFLIPEQYQGVDKIFPRLSQMHQLVEKAQNEGRDFHFTEQSSQQEMPQLDFSGEWEELRRAWNLLRNGKRSLSKQVIRVANKKRYSHDEIQDVPDWIWRFASTISGRNFTKILDDAIMGISPYFGKMEFKEFCKYYDKEMAPRRGIKYLGFINSYFRGYSEFGQIQLLVVAMMPQNQEYKVSSVDFEKVRMFYGNAFELLGELVDFLVLIGNIMRGRKFDTFERLSLGRELIKWFGPRRRCGAGV